MVILLTRTLSREMRAELDAIVPGAQVVSEGDLVADPSLVGRIEVCFAHLPSDLWGRATSLRWFQSSWAGIERLLAIPEARHHPAVFTNARIHAAPISEHLWGMLLSLVRNLPLAWDLQRRRRWDRDACQAGLSILQGKTLCVAGLGEIGSRCARIGRAFGMRVVGIRHDPSPHPDADEVVGPAERHRAFAAADAVMVILPATDATRGFVGRAEFSAMQGSVFLNAGRGSTVDTDALVAALSSGAVRAAGLDVTDPEPLPRRHPLWRMPNVLITPHCAGLHAEYEERAARVFLDNLRRYAAGETLRYVVNKEEGY
jgi:phosphoglycerate dehydrogenase-like enzyme